MPVERHRAILLAFESALWLAQQPISRSNETTKEEVKISRTLCVNTGFERSRRVVAQGQRLGGEAVVMEILGRNKETALALVHFHTRV
jgi:hypothetical protein